MELDEFGVLGASVAGIFFRLGGQLRVYALGLGLGKGKLLREGFKPELRGD